VREFVRDVLHARQPEVDRAGAIVFSGKGRIYDQLIRFQFRSIAGGEQNQRMTDRFQSATIRPP
jgi:hypothetical protein